MKEILYRNTLGGGWLIRLIRLRKEVNSQKNLLSRPSKMVNLPQLTQLTILTTWGHGHFSQRRIEGQ